MVKFVAAALSLILASATANQDSSYYPGWSNPNVNEEMYYRDSVNVLQDLEGGEFSSLYIRYHGCVWSEYGNGSDQQDNDEDGDGTGCGGDGGDEYWYMGRTQCFRANVAYSLYGVKSGSSTKSGSNPCSSKHFINSFFTSYGIESFGDPLGIDYESSGAATSCYSEQTGDDDGGNNNGGGDNDHNQQLYKNYVSYGTGCSSSGEFIKAQFQGAYCDGNHYLQTTGEYDDLNQIVDNLECYEVFSANGEDEDEEDGEGDEAYASGSAAWSLLSASAVCSHAEYPSRCPDPHGLKRSRDAKLYNTSQSKYRAVPLVMPILSVSFLLGAFIFFYMSTQLAEKAKKKALVGESNPNPSLLGGASESFARTLTGLSQRTMSIKERLVNYAEEEDEVNAAPSGDYHAPLATTQEEEQVDDEVSVKSQQSAKQASVHDDPSIHEDPSVHSTLADAADNQKVANAMLSEKGVTPKPAQEAQKQKYKRPRMAKISKFFFGRKKNKNKKSAQQAI